MFQVQFPGLDLRKTADSGQCFRMAVAPGGVCTLTAHGQYLTITPTSGDGFHFSCGEADYRLLWADYFDAGTDYSRFTAAISTEDTFLTAAAAYGQGIRILRQEPWENLVTFILSQRKNIPAIRKCVEALCTRFGSPIPGAPPDCRAFPGPKLLAAQEVDELLTCGLGYRAPYVLSAARMVCEGQLDLVGLERADDETLLAALLRVPGVGIKVANCVRLFGFHRLGAFPRDVWVRRVEDAMYGGRFPDENYPGFSGVLQQYMFYYGRSGCCPLL